MGDKVLFPPPPFLTSMAQLSLTHQCNASQNNFKENLGIQDILIHQNASNLVISLLLAYATSVNVWDNMVSLQ